MNSALYLVAVIVAIAAAYFLLTPLVRLYARFRGTRVVTCPENQQPAAVKVDAVRAALSTVGTRDLELSQCSRWPEKRDCGQECIAQIEASPEDCLVRAILTKWYMERNCVVCGKALGQIDWLHHKPALRAPNRQSVEWQQVPPESIPEVLATHEPICWDCHIAATFRREHPDLVVDRKGVGPR
jgi:hypothetical protein